MTTGPETTMRTSPPTTGDLLERLRARRWRLTPQRRVVAEVLRGEHVHFTAEEVRRRAVAVMPEISQATVYNTLNDLVAMGELRVVSLERGPLRYDPNIEPHDHLRCVSCGRLVDVDVAGKDRLVLGEADRHGFAVLGVDLTFRGVCPACREPRRQAHRARRRGAPAADPGADRAVPGSPTPPA